MTNPRSPMNQDMPNEKGRLLERIGAYSLLGMRKEAVDESRKLVGVAPDDPESFMELGLCFTEKGEIEEAIKCYQDAIKKFPKYSCAYTNLGYCYEKYLRCDDKALVCYEKAVELDPDDAWALNNIGVMHQRSGRREEAFCYYKKACEASEKREGYIPEHLFHNLAWGYYLCRDYERATELFNELLSDDSSATCLSDFGCVKYKMGLYDDAVGLFEKAVQSEPKKKRHQGLYKLALRKAGQ